MRKSNAGATSLPYSPLQKWGLGPWTPDPGPAPQLPSGRNTRHPSWVSRVSGWPCCMLSLGRHSPQPWTLAGVHPAADKALFFIHSLAGHLLAVEPVPGAGYSCHFVFIWVSTPTSEPPGQQARPRPSLLTLADFLQNINAIVLHLHVFRVIPSPSRHDVCFVHR